MHRRNASESRKLTGNGKTTILKWGGWRADAEDRMTNEEWLRGTDVALMVEALWEAHPGYKATLASQLHQYFVACCRRI